MWNLKGFSPLMYLFILLIVSCSDAENKITDETSVDSVSTTKKKGKISPPKKKSTAKFRKSMSLTDRGVEIGNYVQQKGFSTKYCFLIDMSLHSGRNRFFVYDLEQ